MSRSNRTRFAVLGALAQGNKSGYDLKKEFEQRMSHFWAESPGQIYPTLHRLRDEGLIHARTDPRGRPGKTVYSLAASGRRALRNWLKEEPNRESVRNEMLLKLYFGPELGVPGALRHLVGLERSLLRQREIFGAMTAEIESLPVSEEQRAFWHLTLDAGQELGEARLRWCRRSIRTLNAFSTNESEDVTTPELEPS